MAGIAIVLDLLRKNPSIYTGQSLHSYGLFSATVAASAAATAVSAGIPFASRALFGYSLSLSLSLFPPPKKKCSCPCGVDGEYICLIHFGLVIFGFSIRY